MERVLPNGACSGAVGTDAVGLPVFGAHKILSMQAHIMCGDEPMFLCVPGEHYRQYMCFPRGMLASLVSTRWSCNACEGYSKTRHRRMRAIGHDGHVYLLCNLCGKYLHPGAFTPGQAMRWKAGCAVCHAWRWRAHVTRNAASFCGLCGGTSRTAMCGWCAVGAPPITAAMAFGSAVDPIFGARNAAYMVFGPPPTDAGLLGVEGRKK